MFCTIILLANTASETLCLDCEVTAAASGVEMNVYSESQYAHPRVTRLLSNLQIV